MSATMLMTMIARVSDGLPLATSIEGDESPQDPNIAKYTSQAKLLFRKLNRSSPSKSSLESGPYIFHYAIENGACYLCLCDKNLPAKFCFAFLEDLAKEFHNRYGTKIDSVTRPYHFIEFESYIQTVQRKYAGSRARSQLSMVHNELQDVQRIMVQNIEDVIHRGESLTILDDQAAKLAVLSKKYKEDAWILNMRSSWFKLILVLIFVVAFLIYIRIYWY